MKKLLLITVLALSTSVFAGPGGGHSHGHGYSHGAPAVTQEKTQEIGKFHIDRLVKAKKLEATWSEAIFEKSEKKMFKENEEWVVTFNNAKDTKNKTLFIFLKLSGEFVAANFSGK